MSVKAPIVDRNDIQIGECDYDDGGPLMKIHRDGFIRYFVYDFKDQVYVERECKTPEITLTTD